MWPTHDCLLLEGSSCGSGSPCHGDGQRRDGWCRRDPAQGSDCVAVFYPSSKSFALAHPPPCWHSPPRWSAVVLSAVAGCVGVVAEQSSACSRLVELPIPCSGAARSMGVDLLAQTCKRSPGAAYVELDRPQGQSQRALSRSNEWRGVLLSYPRYSWRACYQRKGWTEGMLKESHSAREAQKSCALLFFNSISVKGSHQAKSSSPSACSVASSLRNLWVERCLVVGLKGPWCFLTAGSRHTPARCGGSCTWAGTSLLRTSLMRSQQRLPLYRKCCSTRKVVWKVRKHPGQTSDCT